MSLLLKMFIRFFVIIKKYINSVSRQSAHAWFTLSLFFQLSIHWFPTINFAHQTLWSIIYSPLLPVCPWFLLFILHVPALTIRTSLLLKSFNYSEILTQHLLCARHCARHWNSARSQRKMVLAILLHFLLSVCVHVCMCFPHSSGT